MRPLLEATRIDSLEGERVSRIQVDEAGARWVLELAGSAITVGRGSGASIILSDAAASREHFTIEPRGAEWWMKDLGSRNGTRVNGKVVPNALLRPGDRIEIGAAVLTFQDGGGQDGEGQGGPGVASATPPAASLERDHETGLRTLPWLVRELQTLAARGPAPAVLVKLDVDSLGLVNDVLGYRAGDEAIRAVAGAVAAAFDEARVGALVAREAGGKLVVVLPGASASSALPLVEAARERVASLPFEGPLLETSLSVSAGVAAAPEDAPLGLDLLRKAEAALARAKRQGRDRVARPPAAEHPEARDAHATALLGRSGELGALGAPGPGLDGGAELEPLLIAKKGQRALALAAEALASDLGRDALLDLLLAIVLRETEARRGFVVLNEKGTLVLAAAADRKQPGAASGATLSHGILRAAFESREALLVEDVTRDARFRRRPSVMQSGIKSVLAAPIGRGEGVLGVLYLEQDEPTKSFDREARDLVRAFARLVAGPIRRAAETARAEDDLDRARKVLARSSEADAKRRARFAGVVGRSAAMNGVLRALERISDQTIPVLIRGETGTGKELVARAIHANSTRARGPFVAESCAALTETLLEVELFGCKKGAFTGADRDRAGLFEAADGGTLFLDEVGEMSPMLQAKLLRVLEEKKVRRIGSNETRSVDVRVLSATHRDLNAMVGRGEFRQDLYYRLAVLTVQMPALRERRDDIPLLVEHLLARAAAASGRPAPVVTPDALAALVHHSWPGNVRELENELRKLVALGANSVLREHLSPAVLGAGQPSGAPRAAAIPGEVAALLFEAIEGGKGLHEVFDLAAKETVLRVLDACGGNRSECARRLGVSRPGLRKMFQRFGIE